jgi:hypothetical protein
MSNAVVCTSSNGNRAAAAAQPFRLASRTLLLIASFFIPNIGVAELDANRQGAVRTQDAVQRDVAKICDFRRDLQDNSAPSCRVKERESVFVAQYLSNICYTPVNWCYMPQYAPIGTPCWCPTPYGPAGGYIR